MNPAGTEPARESAVRTTTPKTERLAVPPSVPFDVPRVTAAIKKGDENAFRLFYSAYYDRLFRFLIVLTRGEEELSRDLLQIVMSKIVRGMKKFETPERFWNWLAAIARNSYIDAIRKSKRAPQWVALSSDLLEPAEAQTASENESALSSALDDVLRNLDPEDRQLIDAFYFQAETQQQIAARNDATPKAIESKLARLRQKLRQQIIKRLQHEN